MKNIILYNLLLLVGISCTSQVSKDVKLIAGSDYKLWEEIKDTSRHKGFSTYYWYFNTKGRWEMYVKYKNNTTIVKPNLGDIVLIEKWNALDKDHINIGGKTYKIETLTNKYFVFSDTIKGTSIRLVNSNDKLP